MYQQQLMEEIKLSVTPEVSLLIDRVKRLLTKENFQSYLVGGLVRDLLMGRDSGDIDIAVSANALDVAASIAGSLNGKYVPLDEVNGVGRVIVTDADTATKREIDFSTIPDTIEHDLARRDFTIDALAVALADITPADTGEEVLRITELIDPFDGQGDLNRGIIRAVSDTTFTSDPARLLRAVRLAAELDFTIASETESLIRDANHMIGTVAGERIREELLRLLAGPQAASVLDYLDRLGLLTELVPELSPARGVDQPLIHYWDVFQHSIQTVAAVEFLLGEGEWHYASTEVLTTVPWSTELRQHFNQEVSSGSTRKSLLKVAALLHDIAKPRTKSVDADGRARFLGHPNEGADLAVSILERLRFSARETKMVELEVKNHLRPEQMSNLGMPSHRAVYRYFRDTGDTGIDILFLNLADHLATRGPELELAGWHEHARRVAYVLNKRFEEESLTTPPKLVDGHDLITIFGIQPSPQIGELLEAVREAQATGELTSREQALEFINEWLAKTRHILSDA